MDGVLAAVKNQRGLRVDFRLNEHLIFDHVRQVEVEEAGFHQGLNGEEPEVDEIALQPEATLYRDLRAFLIPHQSSLEADFVQLHPTELLVRRTG